jgi:hypothetical protein
LVLMAFKFIIQRYSNAATERQNFWILNSHQAIHHETNLPAIFGVGWNFASN